MGIATENKRSANWGEKQEVDEIEDRRKAVMKEFVEEEESTDRRTRAWIGWTKSNNLRTQSAKKRCRECFENEQIKDSENPMSEKNAIEEMKVRECFDRQTKIGSDSMKRLSLQVLYFPLSKFSFLVCFFC